MTCNIVLKSEPYSYHAASGEMMTVAYCETHGVRLDGCQPLCPYGRVDQLEQRVANLESRDDPARDA
jgi:hypothetical protein